jgi:hypothetical protein
MKGVTPADWKITIKPANIVKAMIIGASAPVPTTVFASKPEETQDRDWAPEGKR